MASELTSTQDAQRALAAVRGGRVNVEDVGELEAVLTGGFGMAQMEALVSDLRNEPSWRRESDMDCDYFDHDQLSQDTLDKLAAWGLPPAAANIIQPTISAVLGIQAQNRSDANVEFGDDASEPVAKVLGQKLADMERESRADRALSEAYAGQIKAGLGWVEVNTESNPFARCRVRVQDVHRREIWWDWRSKRIDLEDGRYKCRRMWFDNDYLAALFPRFRELLGRGVSNTTGILDDIINEGAVASDRFGMAWDRERTLGLEDEFWLDQSRNRSVIFEIWYRVWKRGVIARIGAGDDQKAVRIDLKNPQHVALIASGQVMPEIGVYPDMRQSFWIGPHRVYDRASKLPHTGDPYTPFWGFRKDKNGAPYGLIRGMRWPQDEVNTRLSKMLSLLTSKRVMYESGALDRSVMDEKGLRREVAKHTAVLAFKDGALRDNRVKIEDNGDLSAQQFSVYGEMKKLVSEVVNVYAPLMGTTSGATSGVAIDQLIQQGMTSLAEINDNFTWGQREVYTQMLEFAKADLTAKGEHTQIVGKGPQAREVVVNQRQPDGTLANAIAFSNVKVSLSEVPQTPTYRQRVFTMIAEAIKSMPPNIQMVMAPMMLEMSNLPGRKEAARFLRAQIGLPDPEAVESGQGESPEVTAVRQEYEPQLQELAARLKEAEQRAVEAEDVAKQKQVDNAVKAHEVTHRAVAEGQTSRAAALQAQAALVAAEGKAARERAEGVASVVKARAEAQRPPEPAIDPKAIVGELMASLEKTLGSALAPVLQQVATLQGQVEAMAKPKPEPQPTMPQAPAVVFEQGAITVNTPEMAIKEGAIQVNVAPPKAVAKEITLPDGQKATITPKE